MPVDPVALARLQANRLGLCYQAEAGRLGRPPVPIIDAHVHVNGPESAKIFLRVMDIFGVERVYSQTPLANAEAVRAVMGDRIRFIAVPAYGHKDMKWAMTEGFLEALPQWAERFGARCVKMWAAPRMRDYADKAGIDPADIVPLDGPWRRRVAERAIELGMMLMVHVGDPDTWFATTYADANRHAPKPRHYVGLERILDDYPVPLMAAHMGGWPENLDFLTGLLDRHSNLILDTSATKWMVRELSRYPRERLVEFFQRFSGRILFGSDIVVSDEHLAATKPESPRFGAMLAASAPDAFDLYASRYWALRMMWETEYDAESNIADPDLMMVEPDRFDALSAPRLLGRYLPADMLRTLYRDAAEHTLDSWYAR
ncbi:MAG: hypothetical protein DYG94_04965 [Leptolyngbya sp. PLA3]|nr:MAG: hypothetical protein EDM82_04115 [Cyanobacteria bacterium CYA]MCE7968084.1 hypothetical protein [Leptolyngbya sp. PL-A3]